MVKKQIVFAIDNNYMEPFIVAVESFLNFHRKEEYVINLLYSGVTESNLSRIGEYARNRGISIVPCRVVDVFADVNVGYHFNSVIFYRLLVAELFKTHGRVLYLDADILFLGNIDGLFDIDLGDAVLAAVPKTLLGVPAHMKSFTDNYFASGLLLFNTRLFCEEKIYEKAMNFLREREYEWPDQDALNAAVNSWIELELKYGVETAFLSSRIPELKKAAENPVIIQFSGSSKPWHFSDRHPYKKLYWKYLKRTPFKRLLPVGITPLKILSRATPEKIKCYIKRNAPDRNG